MEDTTAQIREHIRVREYRQAYALGKDSWTEHGQAAPILSALLELTSELRSQCMGMASRRADSGQEYFALEQLLREASALTKQDLYGNFHD